MKYQIEIAEVIIELDIPFFVDKAPNVTPFFVNKECKPDCRIQWKTSDELIQINNTPIYTSLPNIYRYEDGFIQEYWLYGPESAYGWLYQTEIMLDWKFYIRKNWEKQVGNWAEIVAKCDTETVLNRKKAVLLHASFVKWKGKGVLFSGPSGIGKSTQAELWYQYEQAEIINGDRAYLRKMENNWYAYGLPMAGSSHVFKNEKAEVACLVFLEKGLSNKIERMLPLEAFTRLYKEIAVHTWDIEFVENVLDLANLIIKNIPVLRFVCRPDKSAVEVLRDYLEGV